MKKPHFDDLLEECRGAEIPALPAQFAANVLREIRLRRAEAQTEPGWFSMLLTCLRPGMVAAGLGLALAVGLIVPGLARESGGPPADGLGLHVFSTSAMPSGAIK